MSNITLSFSYKGETQLAELFIEGMLKDVNTDKKYNSIAEFIEELIPTCKVNSQHYNSIDVFNGSAFLGKYSDFKPKDKNNKLELLVELYKNIKNEAESIGTTNIEEDPEITCIIEKLKQLDLKKQKRVLLLLLEETQKPNQY